MVDPTKIIVILNLQALRSVKQLRATLGHIEYYRKFIKSYAQITALMEQLLKKDAMYYWNEDYNKSLEMLKEKMASTPILVFPKWDFEFHVHVDTSCITLGAIVMQPGVEGIDHLITFASHWLSKYEKNYSTTKCEGIAMVYALQKFHHYLLGGHFKMYTDHSVLKYLVNKPLFWGGNCR